MLPHSKLAILVLSFVFFYPSFSYATLREWSGGVFGGGQFTDPGSWFNGVPTNNTTSDLAVFKGFLGGPLYTTVNLSVPRSVKGLGIISPEGTLAIPPLFTFSGSKLTLGADGMFIAFDAGGGHVFNNQMGLETDQSWAINTLATMNGALSGDGELTKDGVGKLTLAASNTNTGDIVVSAGILELDGSGRIFDGADVYIDHSILTPIFRLKGMTDAINGLFGSGQVELVDGATLVVGNSINNSQGIGDYYGVIVGEGGLTKRGPGTFKIAGKHLYTGSTRVEAGILLLEPNLMTTSARLPGTVTVASGGAFGGSGTSEVMTVVQSGGVIFPGGDGTLSPDKTNRLFANGLTLAAGSTLQIDIEGTVGGETLDVLEAGSASIAGLLDVTLLPGFVPYTGQVFEFFSASSLTGEFAMLPQGALVGVFGGTELTIDYTLVEAGRDRVSLVAERGGDFNGNGIVDAADYTVWRDGLGVIYTYDHYNMWKANLGFSIGGGVMAGASEAVPEPAALVLLIFSAACCCLRRRRNA
jgi:autotransporter-associated beta strand protein